MQSAWFRPAAFRRDVSSSMQSRPFRRRGNRVHAADRRAHGGGLLPLRILRECPAKSWQATTDSDPARCQAADRADRPGDPGIKVAGRHAGQSAQSDGGQHRTGEAPDPKEQASAAHQQFQGLRLGQAAGCASLAQARSAHLADEHPALGHLVPSRPEGAAHPVPAPGKHSQREKHRSGGVFPRITRPVTPSDHQKGPCRSSSCRSVVPAPPSVISRPCPCGQHQYSLTVRTNARPHSSQVSQAQEDNDAYLNAIAEHSQQLLENSQALTWPYGESEGPYGYAVPAAVQPQAPAAAPVVVTQPTPPVGAVPAFHQQIFNGSAPTDVTYYRDASGQLGFTSLSVPPPATGPR